MHSFLAKKLNNKKKVSPIKKKMAMSGGAGNVEK